MAQTKRRQGSGQQGQQAAPKGAKKQRKPGELSTFQKAVIIVFIVVFALSTFIGALASMFQTEQNSQVEYNVDYVNSQYTDYVADLESQLEGDPENTDTLLATARACSSWGSQVMMLATTDDETAQGTELIERAIGYYDRYIELDNASDARAERAMCEYYLGDTDTAIADLEAVTTDDPEYAPAFYDLGMLYESAGRTDDALAAYEKCVELDPDNEQSVGDSAQSRIDSLTADDAADSADATDDADDAATDDATADADQQDTTDSSEAAE